MLNFPGNPLAEEYLAMCRHWGALQARCSAAMADQAAHVQRLHAEVVRLRGALIVRDTRLAIAAEALERLARQAVQGRRQALQQAQAATGDAEPPWTNAGADGHEAWVQQAAELVICQAGCVGQGLPWRQQDQCLRTGQPCLLSAPLPGPPTAPLSAPAAEAAPEGAAHAGELRAFP